MKYIGFVILLIAFVCFTGCTEDASTRSCYYSGNDCSHHSNH